MPSDGRIAVEPEAFGPSIWAASGLTAADRDSALLALSRVAQCHQAFPEFFSAEGRYSFVWSKAREELHGINDSLAQGAQEGHAWAYRILRELQYAVRQYQRLNDVSSEQAKAALDLDRDIAADLALVTAAGNSDRLLANGEAVLSELEATAMAARQASGGIGGAKLASYFMTYAGEQARSANVFRKATIALIAVAILVSASSILTTGDSWVSFASRAAAAVGLFTLSAYCGRQSGQHRRIADWASALQVQLLSLEAFLEPITDEDAKSAIYVRFAQRILGPPPELSGSDSASTDMPTAQMLELVIAALRRS